MEKVAEERRGELREGGKDVGREGEKVGGEEERRGIPEGIQVDARLEDPGTPFSRFSDDFLPKNADVDAAREDEDPHFEDDEGAGGAKFVLMKKGGKVPVLTRHDFCEQQKKERLKKALPKDLTALKMLSTQNIRDAVTKCVECGRGSERACGRIDFEVVRCLRSSLHGPTMSLKKRIKLLCQWLYDIEQHNKSLYAAENKPFNKDSMLRKWFVYDYSFPDRDGTGVRKVNCCLSCFQIATGFSMSTIQEYKTRIRGGELSLVNTERDTVPKNHAKSTEWMVVT